MLKSLVSFKVSSMRVEALKSEIELGDLEQRSVVNIYSGLERQFCEYFVKL